MYFFVFKIAETKQKQEYLDKLAHNFRKRTGQNMDTLDDKIKKLDQQVNKKI